MGKGSNTTYTSKGERRNVNRQLLNDMRRDRKLILNPKAEAQRKAHRDSARGAMKEKYEKEDSEQRTARDLWSRYEGVVTWAACVQAAKSNYVSQFHNKYGPRLSKSKG